MLKPIVSMNQMAMNESIATSYDGRNSTLSVYNYLADVAYEVRAHFIPNPYRTDPDLIADGMNEDKHYQMACRMVQKGGRRDVSRQQGSEH